MHATARHPICATSWATATLDTVARPMWLSGIRKRVAIVLSTPIWWRTRDRSGRVAGSISHTTSKASITGSYDAPNGRVPQRSERDQLERPGGGHAELRAGRARHAAQAPGGVGAGGAGCPPVRVGPVLLEGRDAPSDRRRHVDAVAGLRRVAEDREPDPVPRLAAGTDEQP